MLLALSVVSQQSQRLGTTGYRIFDERGGTIGRGKTNDWVLEDPDLVLSTRHAHISFTGGGFTLEDLSTNGTGLNGMEALVPKGQRVPIGDGDRLFLGDFEILVQVIADPPAPAMPPAVPPPSVSPPPARVAPEPFAPGYAHPHTQTYPQAAMPPMGMPPMPAPSAPARMAPEPSVTDYGQPRAHSYPQPAMPPMPATPIMPPMSPATGRPTADVYREPARSPPAPLGSLTDLMSDAPPPVHGHAAAPAPIAATALPGPIDLGSLLAAAGLQPQMVRPEILSQLGEILRVVTAGLIEVLKARKEIKNQFRMTSTIMRPVENNPLKFDRSVEEAMHTLFIKCNPGWLGPREAYQEAFDDLGRHQLATLAGMQAAFGAVLKRFSPDGLEKLCERGAHGGLLERFSKPNYWTFYRTYYEKLSQDSEAAFQQLFGEAFVRAYDEQMRRLESAGPRQT